MRLTLDTSSLHVAPGGVPVGDREEVLVELRPGFPVVVPTFRVDHDRFVGHAHVLQGDRLCLYLDPSQEWHHEQGVVGFLDRLWRWLDDAASGRFDRRTALFHPVGGVLHATAGTPTVVVRNEFGPQSRPVSRRWLRVRSAHRLDLCDRADAEGGPEAAVVTLPGPLAYGAGTSVLGLCERLFLAGRPRALPALGIASPPADPRYPHALEVLAALAQVAARNASCMPLYLVLAVPGSQAAGAPLHLVCGRIPQVAAHRLRDAAIREGPLLRLTRTDIDFDAPIEWCTVSEERPSATIRRDERRPVAPYVGRHVVLVGCGGLGSWAGEFLARAGVDRVTLCDPATVSGGLLVRQDFTELDIGTGKAEALERRLRAIRDDLAVGVADDLGSLVADGGLPECDLLIDATVNNAVATLFSLVWRTTQTRPLVARVSTDRATSTLGLLTVTTPGSGPTPEEVDRLTGEAVALDAALEPHRVLWDPVDPSDELTPAPGCSVPTFHGSAADLAGIAGSLVSLLGPHLARPELAGSHLVGLPHGTSPGHRWVSADGALSPDEAEPEAG